MPVFGAAYFYPPCPTAPDLPAYPRPSRPLPESPREWSAVERTATGEQLAVIIDASVHGIGMIAEGWGDQFDPDCLDGWTLILECAADMRETRPDRCPEWVPDDLELLLDTVSALYRAQALHAAERSARAAEVSRILSAPETDPAWAQYDALCASLGARQAAWEAQHGADYREWKRAQDKAFSRLLREAMGEHLFLYAASMGRNLEDL